MHFAINPSCEKSYVLEFFGNFGMRNYCHGELGDTREILRSKNVFGESILIFNGSGRITAELKLFGVKRSSKFNLSRNISIIRKQYSFNTFD